MIVGDYHTHSQYSHGQGDLQKNIEAALRKGLKELGITDHGPRTYNFVRLGVKDARELLEIKKLTDLLQARYPDIRIMAGVEANIINSEGELDVPEGVLEKLDLVAAGLHLLILPPDLKAAKEIVLDNRITYQVVPSLRKRIRYRNTQAVIRAVRRYKIDFITHPGYQLDIDTYELARVCAEEGTFLEINTRHGKMTEGFVKAAAETGVKFIVNSDAHSPDQVGELSSGIELVRRLKIEDFRIVNYQGLQT